MAVLGGEVPGLVAAARRASESWVKHVGWRNYKGGESKSLDELAALAREAAWEGRGPEGPGRAEVVDLCGVGPGIPSGDFGVVQLASPLPRLGVGVGV